MVLTIPRLNLPLHWHALADIGLIFVHLPHFLVTPHAKAYNQCVILVLLENVLYHKME